MFNQSRTHCSYGRLHNKQPTGLKGSILNNIYISELLPSTKQLTLSMAVWVVFILKGGIMNIRSLLEEGQPLPTNCHYTLSMAKEWLLTQPIGTKAIIYVPKTGEITVTLRYKGLEGKLKVYEAAHV